MLVTGTTIIAVLKALRKPVDKTKESIEQAIQHTAQRREAAEKRKPALDIDLGEGYARGGKKKEKITAAPEEPETFPEPDVPEDTGSGAELEALQAAAAAMNEPEPPAAELETPSSAGEPEETASFEEPKETEESGAAYRFPPLSLLEDVKVTAEGTSETELRARGQLLVSTLKDFGISTRLCDITSGPAVTRYELEPSAGVKISRITGLADDIALRLATTGVRIEAPIPNKAAVGIEVPNKARRVVGLRSLLDTPEFRGAKGKLSVALGQDIEGHIVLADLAKMPHLLIAGTTGSGKSVCTNSMIQSVLFRATPDEV